MQGKRGKIIINEKEFRDKVLGCWLGKNAGGTLGEPLESKFGKDEMFNVSWYPNLPEGGIPNDDLEMQLIWLQALQERGPAIKARDLAEYWLDCIAYNFDEYGLSKTNLKKGLAPPVSGWYNNWFKHCMGSPIRSEIWACVAPGAPEIAAKYAFEDAICDHAGGESVYGEVFNAVMESCAFVIDDKFELLKIGLSAIPKESLTYKAIRKAMELYEKGFDWKEARERIKEEFFNPVAQYSPINMGFQTIGLLYGEDFGDAVCKAVNCGWDTDCTAATLGAILGIILGAKNLPKKWLEPLGVQISTNVTTGGIKNLNAPTNIHELTERVCEMAKRVLEYWNANVIITDSEPDNKTSIVSIKERLDLSWLEKYEPNTLDFDLHTLRVSLRYEETAGITGDTPARFTLRIMNPHLERINTTISIDLPVDWGITPADPVTVEVEPKSYVEVAYSVTAPGYAIDETNNGTIKIKVKNRPELLRLPLVFIGGTKWLASPVFEGKTLEDECGVEETKQFNGRPANWRQFWRAENDLKIEDLFAGKAGINYLLHFIHSETEQKVIIGVPNTNRMKIWLNGQFLHETSSIVPLRPNQGNGVVSGDGSNYAKAVLNKGWNQVLVKIERGEEPLQAHFTIGCIDEMHPKNNGDTLMGVIRSKFIWEVEDKKTKG